MNLKKKIQGIAVMAALSLHSVLPAAAHQNVAMQEMVVTATRFPESRERIPGRIQVIDSQQLAELPYERVDDILNWVSGVSSDRTLGIYELSPRVTMRGLGGNEPGRTLVLIDGLPASIGDTGNMRWNRVNREDIERIEIFKGPGSSIHGSNAMGGVINIITKRPDKPLTGNVSVGYGTYNTKTASARIGLSEKEEAGWYAQMAATGLDSSGYRHLTPESGNYDARTKRFVEELNINSKLGYVFNDQNRLELSHSWYDDKRGEGYKYNLSRGAYREFDTNVLSLRYNGGVADWQWNLAGFYQKENYFWHRDNSSQDRIYRVDSDRIDYGTQANLSKDLSSINTLTIGFDTRFSKVDGSDDYDFTSEYADNKGSLDQYAAYLQNEIRLMDESLILVTGLRYDTVRFHGGRYESNITTPALDTLSGSMPSNSWDAFSPKIAIRYFLSPDYSLFTSYSRGFRAPVLDSLSRYGIFHGRYYDANPKLENETLDSFEIGFDARPVHGLELAASGYYSRGKDFIYSVDTGQTRTWGGTTRSVYQMENVSRVEIYGLEVDADYRMNSLLNFFANYTYSHSTINKFSQRRELEGKRLQYVPRHQVNLGTTILHNLLNASLVLNHKSSQYSDDMNQDRISGYETMDLKLWKKMDMVLPGFNVSLTINNLFDERFLMSQETRSPGRTIIGEISYAW